MENPNENLKAFHEELKVLLDKYHVRLDVTSSIVAVDITELTKEQAEKVGLADVAAT